MKMLNGWHLHCHGVGYGPGRLGRRYGAHLLGAPQLEGGGHEKQRVLVWAVVGGWGVWQMDPWTHLMSIGPQHVQKGHQKLWWGARSPHGGDPPDVHG